MGDSDHESSSKDAESLKLMELNANKAGMQGLDTQRINQIIEEASKGSKFYQHKLKRSFIFHIPQLSLKFSCNFDQPQPRKNKYQNRGNETGLLKADRRAEEGSQTQSTCCSTPFSISIPTYFLLHFRWINLQRGLRRKEISQEQWSTLTWMPFMQQLR